MLTRRQLMKRGAVGGAGLWLARAGARTVPASAALLRPFRSPLITNLPVAQPSGTVTIPDPRPGAGYLQPLSVPRYRIEAFGPNQHRFHPDLPLTATWGYRDANGNGLPYLGPTIVAQKDEPIVVEYTHSLQGSHILPVALTAPPDPRFPSGRPMVDDPSPQIQTHLHGGFIAGIDDGNPYASDAIKAGTQPGSFSLLGGDDGVIYPNAQEATQLWYHDHVLGMTRLNVYAGLAALYFIRDANDNGRDWTENGLGYNPATGEGVPGGQFEVPLVIQDKSFGANGQLFYSPGVAGGDPGNVWIPEFFGDEAVVNAQVEPFFDVEPRMYRFRVVNGANARFFNLEIADGPPLAVIGSEEGMFDKPVLGQRRVLLHNAERADVVVDFRGFEGKRLLLRSAPLPAGVVNPATRLPQIMQFRVKPALTLGTDPGPAKLPASLPGTVPAGAQPSATADRTFTLNEVLVGGAPARVELDLGKIFEDPVDDVVAAGATKEWDFVNPTADTHPIHVHLIKFQVVGRRPMNAPPGAPFTRRATEVGFKDTFGADPGMVTRIRAKFDLPETAKQPYVDALKPGTSASPQKYVVHCHIVEHEDNDMMRPYEVI